MVPCKENSDVVEVAEVVEVLSKTETFLIY